MRVGLSVYLWRCKVQHAREVSNTPEWVVCFACFELVCIGSGLLGRVEGSAQPHLDNLAADIVSDLPAGKARDAVNKFVRGCEGQEIRPSFKG